MSKKQRVLLSLAACTTVDRYVRAYTSTPMADLPHPQICMSSERVIVQRGISKALIYALTTLAKKIQVGVGDDAHIPPLFSTTSAQNVIRLISDARTRGGDVVVGDVTHDGAFVKPHIVLGVEPDWPLWQEETFGPVFGVKVADTEDELVVLANKTNYSLTSAVWTRDIEKGLRIARKIYCGTSPVTLSADRRLRFSSHLCHSAGTDAEVSCEI